MTLTTRDIATREEVGLTKAGLDHTRDQLLLLENFVKEVLRKDEDYGQIPGTHGKPSLLKPGAANIAAAFNCHAEPVIDSSQLDPDGGFVSYEAHVDLVSNLTGLVMARGFGNCNSYEIKYRYRWEGKGAERERLENTEPLDQANTIKKMAIKRAEVDAAMRLPGVARFFTQDLEDMQPREDPSSREVIAVREEFFCALHKTPWFKKGKMQRYAHPIGDTWAWCNMPAVVVATPQPAQAADAPEVASVAPSGPEDGSDVFGPPQATPGPATTPSKAEGIPRIANLGGLWNYGLTIGFKGGKKDCLAALAASGFLKAPDDSLVVDLQATAAELKRIKETP